MDDSYFSSSSADNDDLRFSDLEENSDSDEDLDNINLQHGLKTGHDDTDASNKSLGKVQGIKHLQDLKASLGLDQFKSKKSKQRERRQKAKARKKVAAAATSTAGLVQTLASRAKQSLVQKPVVVVYEDPRKRKRKREEEKKQKAEAAAKEAQGGVEAVPTVNEDDMMSMKQARFDVFKFGQKAFGKQEKEDAEVAQLIRLGAKPPKNKCMDYNELKELRKREKLEAIEQKEEERQSGVKNLTAKVGRFGKKGPVMGAKDKGKKGGARSSIAAKMGSFNGGMLKLSAKDLAKIKSAKVRK